MTLTRREWFALSLASAAAPFTAARAVDAHGSGPEQIARRAARLIAEFESQGYHRTATAVDWASGDWLASQVAAAGLTPMKERFPVDRVDPVTCVLVVDGRRIAGLPLYDGAFTGPDGIGGRLGTADSGADIAVTATATNAAGAGPLGQARRSGRHKAIVALTNGRQPGLCPSNADEFLAPFGPPVLQVDSAEEGLLGDAVARGVSARLIAQVARTPASAMNVVAEIRGTNPALPPFVVMTPRSGWYGCASERGGGLVVWLEIMRALRATARPRSVLFVASSGHELGHLGIDAFITMRPGIVPRAAGWLHLGANIGAAVDPGNTLQASHDEIDAALTREMAAAGLTVNRRNPRDRVPNGEAEAVHRGGGRYASIIGGNALFHNLSDRGPHAIDPLAIARFARACTALVDRLTAA